MPLKKLRGMLLTSFRRRRGLLAAVLVLLFFNVANRIASCYLPPPPRQLYCEHPRRFWTLNPGWRFDSEIGRWVYINSLGLRGTEPDRVRPDLTVLMLGDSCTYGSGVRSSFTMERFLEKRLCVLTGKRVRVYNGGCPGYSSYQGLDLLRQVGPRIHPDIVVIAYMYGDCFHDVMEDCQRLGGALGGMLRTWLWKSSLYCWLRARFRPAGDGFVSLACHHSKGQVPRCSITEYAHNLRAIARLSRSFGATRLIFLRLPQRDVGPPSRGHDPHAPTPAQLRLGPIPPGTDRADLLRSVNPIHAVLSSYSSVLMRIGEQDGLALDGQIMWRARKDRASLFWDRLHFDATGCAVFADDLARVMVWEKMVPLRSDVVPRKTGTPWPS